MIQNNIRLAIFDFDGTLANSFPWFIQSYNQIADKHQLRKIAPEDMASFRGYTVREMMTYVGMPAWKMPFVAADFKALMQDNLKSVSLFDGVDTVLQTLSQQGMTLAVVSSNALENIHPVLGEDNVSRIDYFDCGVSVFGKATKIAKAARKLNIPTNATIYIGDQTTDIEAARKAGVAFGAVSWGYNTVESLRQHSPDMEFAHVTDILRIQTDATA